ncbi:MAG TPA: GH92 family glycosyl hydrolase [Ktedonobacteraceae bacterium]
MSHRQKNYLLAAIFLLLSLGLFPHISQTQAYSTAHIFSATPGVNYASLVNPFVGTAVQRGAPFGGGYTFPGATVPFGMVQWSPDTLTNPPGGYAFSDTSIKGFSLTHLNGAGCSAFQDIPFLPYVGTLSSSPELHPTQYMATFSHADETAYAGYYRVKLQNRVTTELTATQRSGAARFTYPAGQRHKVAPGYAQYANFSGWDIYRSEAQLLAFLAPSQASDIAQSMVNDYTQSGMLPKWSLANRETYDMVGDPADAIIADIYACGGTHFDTSTALSAMIQQASRPNKVRLGLAYQLGYGYVPRDKGLGFPGSGAYSLEYDSADFALAAFAQALGDAKDSQRFVRQAQNWKYLLNTQDRYLEPRYLNGTFLSPYSSTTTAGWIEGDGAQYTWMVPFNLGDLFQGLGGNSVVVSRLNAFFGQLNGRSDSPYAFLGNEPSLGTPWEYDYAGAPYQTQRVVRQVENTLYTIRPDGLPGNDDLGEMSSWYVWAALGMFPETPGTANLVLASPLFPSITITRPGGQTIIINAPGASASTFYVQSLLVNGLSSEYPWLPPWFMMKGGTLDYVLSTNANTSWGSAASHSPPSYRDSIPPQSVMLRQGIQ